jgi:geranylgeranyl pyrophosphate synthase
VQVLAQGIGTAGMAGGQAIDLEAVGTRLNLSQLEQMHRCKTGALVRSSVLLGAIAAGVCAGVEFDALSRYGAELGLAFQIQDDVLDVAGDTETMGKKAGADAARGKPTYPSVVGVAASRELAQQHADAAMSALAALGTRGEDLAQLAALVVSRTQ